MKVTYEQLLTITWLLYETLDKKQEPESEYTYGYKKQWMAEKQRQLTEAAAVGGN